jgi:hypothetical protein
MTSETSLIEIIEIKQIPVEYLKQLEKSPENE